MAEWGVRLKLERLRFRYVAMRTLQFPGFASNKLRGIIGKRLWERDDDAYDTFFAPVAEHGPSGLTDPPRPFVLRSQHLDGARILEGRIFISIYIFSICAGSANDTLRVDSNQSSSAQRAHRANTSAGRVHRRSGLRRRFDRVCSVAEGRGMDVSGPSNKLGEGAISLHSGW